jgi:hypothetical protein
MNSAPMGFGIVMGVLVLTQFAWYVAVLVLLYKIWMKVRNLPNA